MKICPACRFDRCDDTATRCRQCGADLTVEEEDEGNPALASAWFHYLTIPQIGTVELVPGKAFIMGKNPRNDLRLTKCPDDEAARIFWTDDYDEAELVPAKGAKWAVKVDGIRVSGKPRTLKGGEELELGPIVFKYLKKATPVEGATRLKRRGSRPTGGTAEPTIGKRQFGDRAKASALEPNQRTLGSLSKPLSTGGSSARGGSPGRSAGPSGGGRTRATVRPVDVAKAIEQTKAFGTLRVSGRAGRGWVTVRGGKPQHAAFGELTGPRALAAILRLGPCSCYLDPGVPKLSRGEKLEVGFAALAARLANPARRPPPRGGVRPRAGGRPGRPGRRPPPRGRR